MIARSSGSAPREATTEGGETVISQANPEACPECLRRSRLLAHLAPYIEKLSGGGPASRSLRLWRLGDRDLVAAAAPQVADELLSRVAATPEAKLQAELEDAGCWAVCRHDPLYPAGLRDAADAPWALIGRGDPTLLMRLSPEEAVTVVGARRASTYGREVARELGRELASAGLIVVSGLAFGIDACAHRGALDGGLTVAVCQGDTVPTRWLRSAASATRSSSGCASSPRSATGRSSRRTWPATMP